VASQDSSLPTADFTGEVDTMHCRFAVKVAAQFALAGVVWSRGCKRGACGCFPVKAERDKEGETGPIWTRHAEKKKMGPSDAQARALGGAQWHAHDGGRQRSGQGRRAGVRPQGEGKSGVWGVPGGRLMGQLLWVGPK
jgi:hypothetical protein